MSDAYTSSGDADYRFVDRFDPDYPKGLQDISNPPAGLYVKGKLPDPAVPSVAIVGSRICSQYGRLMAEHFGSTLAKNGVQIISGLARGIDGIAQGAAASAGGSSFGILGCGVNVVYPSQNKGVYSAVLSNGGGIISEVRPDAPPIGKQFVSRNRIISALADIVLVIEAKEKSGTQITVQRALEQGKDIYVVPGRLTDICSAGCNKLIAQGAGVALDPEMLLSALGIYKDEKINAAGLANGMQPLEAIEQKVYSELDFYPINIEEIAKRVCMPMQELLNVIFHLQMKRYVKETGRNYYIKLI